MIEYDFVMDNNFQVPHSGRHRGDRYPDRVCSARSDLLFELIDFYPTPRCTLPRRWLNHCLKFRELFGVD